jgi:hypothetical protein
VFAKLNVLAAHCVGATQALLTSTVPLGHEVHVSAVPEQVLHAELQAEHLLVELSANVATGHCSDDTHCDVCIFKKKPPAHAWHTAAEVHALHAMLQVVHSPEASPKLPAAQEATHVCCGVSSLPAVQERQAVLDVEQEAHPLTSESQAAHCPVEESAHVPLTHWLGETHAEFDKRNPATHV